MKQTATLLSIFSLLFLVSLSANAQKNYDTEVEALLAKMTLEEKVGQMNQYNGFYDITGPVPKGGNAAMKYEHLKKGWVGSMLNVHGVEQVRKLQELVVNESRLGIPLIFGYDVIHGYKTQAPIPLAESASWDLEAIERSAAIAADEASAVGLNWTFAPMIDISRDARWGRVMEGAGEDPYLGSKIAVARVKGFQGTDLSKNNTIAACLKHFAAYGFAEAGRDYNTSDVGLNTLYNVVLPPFEAAIKEGEVRTVMNSFNTLNGIPATGDVFLQRDILKGKWGFKGFVISDWGSIGEMVAHGFAEDLKNAGELAVKAGSDMDMEATAYVTHLVDLVNEGKVDVKLIDDAVRRILRVKFELGLFEDPYRYCDLNREKERLLHPNHLAGVLDVAKKSIVLLKNEKQLLPLDKNQKGIVIIGDLADDKNSPLGSWRLASDNNSAVSFLEGFKKYNSNFTFVQGPKIFNDQADFLHHVTIYDDPTGMQEAIEAAKNAAVVVMVLGEHGFMTGEGRSRTRIDLPGLQPHLLKEIKKVNDNIVLVLMNGRPLDLSWEDENIPTILETWQLGSETGNAIAKVLFGDYNPSGKLPMSFPRNVGQLPLYYNRYSTGRPDEIPLVFWSHYGDEKNEALYPFGHGLSYTNFSYSNLTIDASNSKNVQVSVTVKNTGKVFGEEVVQLYINDVAASIVQPIKALKGFEKIGLEPGASKTVSFSLTEKELGFYNNSYEWVVEPGTFNVMVGGSSASGLKGSFKLQ